MLLLSWLERRGCSFYRRDFCPLLKWNLDMTSLASTMTALNTVADENTNVLHECYCSDIHIVQIYTCIPQSHFLSNSGNSFSSTVICFFSCLALQSLTFLLLLPTDPIRYFAASCNSPPVSSHVFRATLAVANNQLVWLLLFASRLISRAKGEGCMPLSAAATHSRWRSCCQELLWNSPTTSLHFSGRYGLPADMTVLKHTSRPCQ